MVRSNIRDETDFWTMDFDILKYDLLVLRLDIQIHIIFDYYYIFCYNARSIANTCLFDAQLIHKINMLSVYQRIWIVRNKFFFCLFNDVFSFTFFFILFVCTLASCSQRLYCQLSSSMVFLLHSYTHALFRITKRHTFYSRFIEWLRKSSL